MSKQSRAYNGIDYARCKSMNDLLREIRRATEVDEFELSRRTADVEPRDMQEHSTSGEGEERRA